MKKQEKTEKPIPFWVGRTWPLKWLGVIALFLLALAFKNGWLP